MLFYLILLLTVVPAVELYVLIKVGQMIGAMNTLAVIVMTGVLGAGLARYQGFQVLQKIQINLNRGIMPTDEMIDGLFILIGGLVLLTPGFITDAMGFCLLLPATRQFIRWLAKRHINRMIREGDMSGMRRQADIIMEERRDSEDSGFEDADFY